MVYNQYAVGAKIYNGGSSAATSGTLDPTGYINRAANSGQLAKQSASRSGLAASALDRINSYTSKPAAKSAPKPAPKPVAKAPAKTTPALPPAAPPQLVASPTGQLIPMQPLDTSDIDLSIADATTDATNTTLAANNQYSQALENYAGQERGYQQQQVTDNRTNLNSFVNRGMVQSSGYGTSVNDLSNQYTNVYSQLAQQRAQALLDRDATTSEAQRSLNSFTAQANWEKTRRGIDFAGTLGNVNPTAESNYTTAAQEILDKSPKLPTTAYAPSKIKTVVTDGNHTLAQILKREGMSLADFQALNPGLNVNKINMGAKLRKGQSFKFGK